MGYKILDDKHLTLGTDYYPEHWSKELWREDLERMKKVGIETIRIAEFAWSIIEKTEGEFNYDFFDEFLDLTDEVGMQVIFSTPTATPPAWLTEKYPEVLNASKDGVKYRHGARRHYNYNSKKYQELSARIVEAFASHYAKRKSIIGWQIDNEVNCEFDEFYSEADSLAFRVYLKEKYQTLDALNAAWGTVFWNQTYTAWEEIYVPQTTCSDSTNPHRVFDYLQFISVSARRFVKMQSDIVCQYIKPGDFITTNGTFDHLDNHQMNQESLDFYTYDSYPNFAYCLDEDQSEKAGLKDRKWSRNLAETRAISERFGIMEQQSGANGWNTRMEAPTPRPGQLTLWTMQSVAHGADYIGYFRWRTCTFGSEMYWHGILDYSGRDNRRLREVASVNEKFQAIQELAGSRYEAEVGVVRDYLNIWDSQVDVWHSRVEKASQKALYEALQLTHTPMDYVYIDHIDAVELLKKYKVLFYPHATIVDEKTERLLRAYVEQGGQLVFACRSGYKDRHGQCVMDKLPGILQDLCGTDIPEYTFISPDSEEVLIDWDGTTLKASVFVDELTNLEGAETVGHFTTEYYAGSGALVRKDIGKGSCYYYGTAFNRESVNLFLDRLGVKSPYSDVIEMPEICELAVRKKDGIRYYFVLNYKREEAKIILHDRMINMYTGEEIDGEIILPEYGTIVLRG